jgi:formate dehydrogenase major subunit
VSGDSANDLFGITLDPNVLIQESKVGTCDLRPGRRPTGRALLEYIADYQRRAGIADDHEPPIVTARGTGFGDGGGDATPNPSGSSE